MNPYASSYAFGNPVPRLLLSKHSSHILGVSFFWQGLTSRRPPLVLWGERGVCVAVGVEAQNGLPGLPTKAGGRLSGKQERFIITVPEQATREAKKGL